MDFDWQPGQDIGRYHIIEKIGSGGMATVYKAYDMRLKREIALKVIRHGAIAPDYWGELLARFERESIALAKLDHPNIVAVYDFGEVDGAPYLVMKYVGGGTLKQLIGKPLPCREAATLLLPVARALDYAHRNGIIHRDVKPANILLSPSGEPVLSDFGIARLLESDGATLTGTGVGVGTPEYMAPEQWTGKTTPQTDIYALGVVFYELVTGKKPYTADTPAAVLLKQMNEPLPRPRLYNPGLSEEVERVLFKALAKNVEIRYLTIAEFATALEGLLSEIPVNEPLPGETQTGIRLSATAKTPLPQYAKRRIPVWLWISAGIALVAGLTWIAGHQWGRISGQPTAPGSSLTLQADPTTAAQAALSTQPVPTRTAADPATLTITLTLTPAPTHTKMPTSTLTQTPTQSFTPTPSATLLGGGSGFIIFASNIGGDSYKIYQMAVDGTQKPILINKEIKRPFWLSPDGKRVATVNDNTGNYEIYLMYLDGSNLINLTHNAVDDSAPVWSPESKRLAFISYRDNATGEIYVIDADGSNLVQLTKNNINEMPPIWSPDGKRIAYISNPSNIPGDIFIMNADGSNPINLTKNGNYEMSPMWSPDGLHLSFHRFYGGKSQIYIMDADGANVIRLTDTGGDEEAWSPDGKQLAVVITDNDNKSDIYIMNADGSNRINLSKNGTSHSPVWSLDGQYIVFSSQQDGNQGIIYRMNSDGSNIVKLTDIVGSVLGWQP